MIYDWTSLIPLIVIGITIFSGVLIAIHRRIVLILDNAFIQNGQLSYPEVGATVSKQKGFGPRYLEITKAQLSNV
ncbi:hypothetical protein AB6A40_008607 [Gnathostoma spinigerum]|uniref:Uncharacterized protein n=1 Tax=Gnathostoma spinigerum TaxID=75299 RepID=A0ABD6EXU7_9BILA